MGGRAIIPLIGREAERLDIKTRNGIISNLSDINALIPVREIKEKKDFGDIDFLFSDDIPRHIVLNRIISIMKDDGFTYNGQVPNDNVYSLAFNNYQIDIIFINSIHKDTSYYYFADNDRGNLVGSIYHKLNFNYGHQGLFIKLENTKILLSLDTEKILQFLNCDRLFIDKVLKYGFDTFEEMYHDITQIPYFSSEYFKFENLNNQNRTRNSKRNTFINFIKFLEGKTFNDPISYPEYMKFKALSFFNKEKEYIELLKTIEKNKVIRKNIDGNLISQITGLKEKKLGEFVIYFKEKNSDIIENPGIFTENQIIERIKDDFKFFSKNT